MGWSITEDLLCMASDGSVSIYDMHGAIKKTVSMGQVCFLFMIILEGQEICSHYVQ